MKHKNTQLTKRFVFSAFLFLLTFSFYGQTVEWVKGTGSENDNDAGLMVQVDSEGSVFTSGLFTGFVSFDPNSNDYDFDSGIYASTFLQKFDADGNFLWAKVFLSDEPEYPILEIDSNDNIYIAAEFKGAIDLDPGPNEDIRVCPAGSWNSYIVKVDTNGNYLWGKDFEFSGSDKYVIIQSMAMDSNNNLLLSGTFHGTIDFDFGQDVNLIPGPYNHGFFLKIDDDSTFQWVKTIGGIFNYLQFVKTVFDHNNNIIIGGSFAGPAIDFDPGSGEAILSTSEVNNHDVYILKLDAIGNFQWVRKAEGKFFDTPDPYTNWAGSDTVTSLAVDKKNDIYFTGSFYNAINFEPDTEDFLLDLELPPCTEQPCERIQTSFIAKMNADGNMVWAKNYDGDNRLHYIGVGYRSYMNLVWINENNELYFGLNPYGTIEVEVENEIKSYSSDNKFITFLNINRDNGSALNAHFIGNEFPVTLNDIKVVYNKVYATGSFKGELFFDDDHSLLTHHVNTEAFTLKMKGNTLNLTKIKPEIFSIYPNPTDGIFQFNATDNKILNVSIFDVQGRVLKSYNNPNQNSVFDVLGYTDGVYLVNVTLMNGSISTYKIIKK